MPHVAQVVSIFRILGIGYKKENNNTKSMNNLVQVGTGEGKSVIMAITACVFALIGVEVNCSCYSDYLSTRDKNDFISVFQALGIEDRIEYGTFNKLCENLLNEQCNVREKVRDMIGANLSSLSQNDVKVRIRPKVLLIDEVDVFLSEKFYGGLYTPSVYLKDALIKSLLDEIWQQNKVKKLFLNAVKAMPSYQQCANRQSNWVFLLDEAVKDMLAALQSYKSSTYIVHEDKIVYVEGEGIVENVTQGYDTVWAYYFENEKGVISQDSLEKNVGIIIHCGTFSYAEMPLDFAYITGVSGTLKTLARTEKEILRKVYKIEKNTYMPSVFGQNNRNYNSNNDVLVENQTEYYMRIRGEIDILVRAKRAILIFFENEEKLLKFYNSDELASIISQVQFITEKVASEDRERLIKRAAIERAITLLTRAFGRGTDFICSNQQVLSYGGIAVLQTFFSEELSDEYQIMGRGARQGDPGSYKMILLDEDLEWVLGSNWAKLIDNNRGSKLYETLNTKRNEIYEGKCGGKELSIGQCRKYHDSSTELMKALTIGNIDIVKTLLTEYNQGPKEDISFSRTVLLMDATGSMASLLSAAKNTVCTMFERASSMLEEKGFPSDSFQMQFAVYRDYYCRELLFQCSSWESKSSNLRSFMKKVRTLTNNDGEEAIEIGLWHAFEESQTPEGISQIILIGDAPPKEKPAIARDRERYGGEAYWATTRFKTPTYYLDEVQKIKAKKIPIHCFYLDNWAEQAFQLIASETGRRCEKLEIQSSMGAEMLTNFVTEEVLRKSAGSKGDEIVEAYRNKFKKSFT